MTQVAKMIIEHSMGQPRSWRIWNMFVTTWTPSSFCVCRPCIGESLVWSWCEERVLHSCVIRQSWAIYYVCIVLLCGSNQYWFVVAILIELLHCSNSLSPNIQCRNNEPGLVDGELRYSTACFDTRVSFFAVFSWKTVSQTWHGESSAIEESL